MAQNTTFPAITSDASDSAETVRNTGTEPGMGIGMDSPMPGIGGETAAPASGSRRPPPLSGSPETIGTMGTTESGGNPRSLPAGGRTLNPLPISSDETDSLDGFPPGIAMMADNGVLRELPCVTRAILDVQLCAPQRGGLLVSLKKREMDEVAKDEVVAQLDDRLVQQSLASAEARVRAAKEEAEKDISVRYAKVARDSAQKELEYHQDTNRRETRAVPAYEMRRYELKYVETGLQIEQAEYEQGISKLKLDVAEAEAAAAAIEVDIRQVKAPVAGIITQRFREEGEWLSPGTSIVRLLQLDELYVQGHVPATLFEPYELHGKPVRVRIPLARGQLREIETTIHFSNPLVRTNGSFLVQAIIPNPRENGRWVLRPGVDVMMTLPEM